MMFGLQVALPHHDRTFPAGNATSWAPALGEGGDLLGLALALLTRSCNRSKQEKEIRLGIMINIISPQKIPILNHTNQNLLQRTMDEHHVNRGFQTAAHEGNAPSDRWLRFTTIHLY